MRSNEPTHTRSASSVICEWGNWTDTLRSQFLWTDSGRGLANNTRDVAEENAHSKRRAPLSFATCTVNTWNDKESINHFKYEEKQSRATHFASIQANDSVGLSHCEPGVNIRLVYLCWPLPIRVHIAHASSGVLDT